MVTFNILTIIVGIASIIANIWIARYNVGKNRLILGTEEVKVHTDRRDGFEELNGKLTTGKYTILTAYQDLSNVSNRIYVLGKVSE